MGDALPLAVPDGWIQWVMHEPWLFLMVKFNGWCVLLGCAWWL